MSFARVILTLLLAAWLPLSCCCRLHALQDTFADILGVFGSSHVACSHCHRESTAPGEPDQDCACDSHDQAFVRVAQNDVHDEAAQIAPMMPVPAVLMALIAPPRPVDTASVDVDARLKAGSTLLRLHCALTI
jgi:hypothetical protein